MRDRSSYDYDSIIDEERRDSMEDSLFEKTGHRSSMSSDSVFGYDDHNVPNGHLLPPNQFRPLSVLSFHNDRSPMKEDDTMISMLGEGGHVRRRSIGAGFEASPCVRVEKRKHNAFQDDDKAPSKARILTKPSIASTSSSKFGGERMIKARQGLVIRQSLEESALVAEGEDIMAIRPAAVFTRPSPKSRSRSSTITTSSSGADTPPLSSAEGSSMSDGSRSSIDLSQINVALSNTTHPMSSSTTAARMRARGCGHGHRRCYSAAPTRASRSSVYETIQEERGTPSTIGSRKSSSPTACQGIYIVDPDSGSVDLSADGVDWDDERGIVALRKYYALRHEAEDTVTESKRLWSDTPFSVYALLLAAQELRGHASAAPALGPDLQPTTVGAGPAQAPASPESPRPSPAELHRAFATTHALQAVELNATDVYMSPAVPSPKRENAWGLAPNARPRVASAARRTALGWAKRSIKASKGKHQHVGDVFHDDPWRIAEAQPPQAPWAPYPGSCWCCYTTPPHRGDIIPGQSSMHPLHFLMLFTIYDSIFDISRLQTHVLHDLAPKLLTIQ
ncbi:hypothetical protein B0H14DRAFT_2592484 [Mycena olivaceomarginata]|nr:hypothetical protein B0H14DRAFT_2592484 [Mycena olivaceomarginata]